MSEELNKISNETWEPADKIHDIKAIQETIEQHNPFNIEVWAGEYEIRQFVSLATRWDFKAVKSSVIPSKPFGMFQYYVENAVDNYINFGKQIQDKIKQANNTKAIEIDLKHRFIVMIDEYLTWYEKNNDEFMFDQFEPNNPYRAMFLAIVSTRHEILKHFPLIYVCQ